LEKKSENLTEELLKKQRSKSRRIKCYTNKNIKNKKFGKNDIVKIKENKENNNNNNNNQSNFIKNKGKFYFYFILFN